MSARELLDTLDQELNRLPDRYRAPLVLCYLEGKKPEEAAHTLGCARSTLHERLQKGRALLQKRLEGRSLVAGTATFVPDPAIGRGDCRVESGDALALAQLPVQLAEMRRRMLRSLDHAQA